MENLGMSSCSSQNLLVGLGSDRPGRFLSSSSNLFRVFRVPNKAAAAAAPNKVTISLTSSSSRRSYRANAVEKLGRECFASLSSSSRKEMSSAVANPQIPVQPPPSYVGTPLFWIGVGVAFSAVFSWAASSIKRYAMQQAFKTVMGQMDAQNNPFTNPAVSSGSPFPFPSPPVAQNNPFTNPVVSSGSHFPSSNPPATSTPDSPSGPASQRVVTVDKLPTKMEAPPATKEEDALEMEKPNKNAFVDVPPEDTLKSSPFGSFEEPKMTEKVEDSKFQNQAFQNGAASKMKDGAFGGSSSTKKTDPILSVEALEKMMEDPTVQSMVYPYLPEEMRNPTTFKWMLQNPQYRQQLQEMLNSMGGSNEWDSRMMDSLKNFDLSSPEVKQQFDQIGLTPEEVISKIMANPEVAMAFQNPRVQAAIMDCSKNPLSIAKYQNDKEVMDVFTKISELFPGVTGP